MPDLTFRIDGVDVVPYAAVPTLAARLVIANARPSEPIHSITLNCQVQIEPLRRQYSCEEEARLLDLFGERERWARTMKSMLWTIAVVKVPAFTSSIEMDVPLPCSLDFNIAATKYFYGLRQGQINGTMLFSGTIFYADPSATLQVSQIPWDRESRFQVPLEIWRSAIDSHYPDSTWLRLSRETFDRLYRYKVAHSIPMWDQLIERVLDGVEATESEKAQVSAGSRPDRVLPALGSVRP
jgi:hypothetical protein